MESIVFIVHKMGGQRGIVLMLMEKMTSIFDEEGDEYLFQDENTKTLYVGGYDTLGGDGKHSFYSSQDGGKNSVDANGKDDKSIFDGGGGVIHNVSRWKY